jgi:hypothetical protein
MNVPDAPAVRLRVANMVELLLCEFYHKKNIEKKEKKKRKKEERREKRKEEEEKRKEEEEDSLSLLGARRSEPHFLSFCSISVIVEYCLHNNQTQTSKMGWWVEGTGAAEAWPARWTRVRSQRFSEVLS